MICTRRMHLRLLGGAITGSLTYAGAIPSDFNTYTDEDRENFLKLGRIVSIEDIGHGVTKPIKAGLEFNGAKHAANIQVVDKELPDFFPPKGPPIPMRDSWRYNVAAYKLDRLLDLRMVPAAVRRSYRDKQAAFSWWVDDVLFEEVDRIRKDLTAPDPENFSRQMALARVFDELIINIDRNNSNLLITKTWNVALIDHSRAFTAYHGIRNEANLTRCSNALMAKMKVLTEGQVSAAVGPLLTRAEIGALMARRGLLIDFFQRESTTKGADKVLFS